MPLQETISAGKPCWVDLVSGDLEFVKPFYAQLLGWDFAEMGEDFGGYNIISGEHGPVGGAMQHDPETMGDEPGQWDMYFAVEDAQKSLDAVAAAGGKPTVQPMPIAEQGTMAFADDINGSVFGLWQPDTLKGFAAWGEPGYPAWFELHTRDYSKSVEFYQAVLPVKASTQEMPGNMNYSTLDVGGEQSAGIWDVNGVLPVDAPTGWTIWFFVEDSDATCARAKTLGGAIVMDPEDTEHGRAAVIQDPAGAAFNVISGGGM